jgi:hypothetical protein
MERPILRFIIRITSTTAPTAGADLLIEQRANFMWSFAELSHAGAPAPNSSNGLPNASKALRGRRWRRVAPSRARGSHVGATVSALLAPRAPSGSSAPVVVSRVVWCSISAFSSAPMSTMVAEIQIHVMKPMAAPSEP